MPKISELPNATGLDGNETMPVVKDGQLARASFLELAAAAGFVSDSTAFPGTRNLYGVLHNPSPSRVSSGPTFSRDFTITIPAGTSNAYQYTTIASIAIPLVEGQKFVSTIEVVSGTIGTRTLTVGSAQTYTQSGDHWIWEGVVPASTDAWNTRINNGSASEPLVIRHRFATGPATATSAAPQANAVSMAAFFANRALGTDANRAQFDPIVINANDSDEVYETTDNLGFKVGDTAHVLFYAETVKGETGVLSQPYVRATAGNQVRYNTAPVADQPGWWYGEIYLDPADFSETEITEWEFRVGNLIAPTIYTEEPCRVSVHLYEDPLPAFSRTEVERVTVGKGLRSVGVMGQNYTWAGLPNPQFYGYDQPLDGRVARVYAYSDEAGTQSIARLDRATGAFLSAPITFDHAGGGWQPVDLPVEWQEAKENQIIGVGPGLTGTPADAFYATGNTPFSSWYVSAQNGSVAPISGNFFIGIWYEIEDEHGIVSRFGDGTNEPLSYIALWVMGQSNEQGYGDRFSDVAAPGSLMWNRRQSSILALSDPTGLDLVGANAQFQQGGSRFPALAKAISDASNGRIGLLVVNSAVAGSKIAEWESGDANWTNAVGDWNAAMDAAHAADVPILGCGIVGFMGESDGISATNKNIFKTGILDLVARARAIASPKAPVFVRPTGQFNDQSSAAGLNVIRQAYTELVNENERFYMTFPASYTALSRGMMKDTFHFFQEEQDAIGQTMAPIVLANAPQAVPLNYTLGVART